MVNSHVTRRDKERTLHRFVKDHFAQLDGLKVIDHVSHSKNRSLIDSASVMRWVGENQQPPKSTLYSYGPREPDLVGISPDHRLVLCELKVDGLADDGAFQLMEYYLILQANEAKVKANHPQLSDLDLSQTELYLEILSNPVDENCFKRRSP